MKNLIVSLALIATLFSNACSAGETLSQIRQTLGFEDLRVNTKLDDLLSSPKAYYNKSVTIRALYRGPGTLFLSNLSPFTAEQYLNFHIWPYGAELWSDKGIRSLFTTCYLSRYNDNFDKLRSMPPYTPIIIHARVDGVVENTPLLEVKTISFIEEPRLSKMAITQMRKGYAWFGEERYDTASLHFNRALQENPPLWASLEIETALADIAFNQELYEQARLQYLAILERGATRQVLLPRIIKASLESKNSAAINGVGVYGAELTTLNPADPWGHLASGITLYKKRDYRAALQSLQRSLFRDQGIRHTYLWKARSYIALGESKLAITAFLEGLTRFENNILLNSELAETYLRESEYAAALPYFKKLTEHLVPSSAHFPWRMAECKIGLNDEEGAIKALEIALDRDPKHLDALITLGGIHFSNKRYGQATTYLTRAIAIDPSAIEAHIKLGFMSWETKKLNEAEKHFNTALALNPDHLRCLLYMGKVNWQQGKIDLSLQRLSHLVALTPADRLIRLDLARRAQSKERHQIALKHFTVLSAAKPHREESLFALSVSNIAIRNYKAAQANLEALATDYPANLAGLNNLSYLCTTKLQQYEIGLKYGLAAAELAPANPAVLDSLGLAYYYTGDFAKAEKSLRKAQQLEIVDLKQYQLQDEDIKELIAYHLGMSLNALKQYEEALKVLHGTKNAKGQLKKDIEALKLNIAATLARLKAEAEALKSSQEKAAVQKQSASATTVHEKRPARLKPVTKVAPVDVDNEKSVKTNFSTQ